MDKIKEIETLIDKAANAEKPEDALLFSQAASNAASALCAVCNEVRAAKGFTRK